MSGRVVRDVDCVILNWRDAVKTARAVRSLVSQPEVRSVRVVDNESDHFSLRGELQTIASGLVELIELEENLGFSAGVNVGLRAALDVEPSGYVLVMNNDAWLAEGSVASLRAALKMHMGFGVVGPCIVETNGETLDSGHAFRRLTLATRAMTAGDGMPAYLTWACVLVSQECLRRAGLLDERYFMYWEDVEFGLRVRKLGFQPQVVRDATLFHETSSSHARAGWKIHLFSALGVVVTARIFGRAYWLGAALRLCARFGARLLHADVRGAVGIVKGVYLGLLVDSRVSASTLLRQRGVVR